MRRVGSEQYDSSTICANKSALLCILRVSWTVTARSIRFTAPDIFSFTYDVTSSLSNTAEAGIAVSS